MAVHSEILENCTAAVRGQAPAAMGRQRFRGYLERCRAPERYGSRPAPCLPGLLIRHSPCRVWERAEPQPEKSLIPDATASLARIALRAALRPLFYFPIPARSAGRFSSILSLSPVAWFKCDCQDQEYRVIIGVSSYC